MCGTSASAWGGGGRNSAAAGLVLVAAGGPGGFLPNRRPSQVASVLSESLLTSRGHRKPSFSIEFSFFSGNELKARFF